MNRRLLIGIPAALVLGVAGLYGGAWLLAKRMVDEQLTQLVSSGDYQQAAYTNLWLLPNGTLVLRELNLQQQDFKLVINSIEVSNIDYLHAIPWHLAVRVDGLHFPDGLTPLYGGSNRLLATALEELVENDTLPVQASYSYHFEPANDEQIVYDAALSLPGYFDAAVSSETRHLSLQELQDMREAAPEDAMAMQQAALADTAIPRAELQVTDRGIVDKYIASTAENLGTDAATLRPQLKSQVQNYHLFLPDNLQSLAITAGSALASFLDGGKTLRLTITPSYGGKLEQLQPEIMGVVLTGDFERAATLLKLEIVAE